jgi:hypothetical protein
MATRDQVATLRHFRWEEFRHPDGIHWPLLQWLDEVRHRASVPLVPTSDARAHVPPGGSRSSLHLAGRAIDFRWRGHTPEDRARLIAAVVTTPIPEGEGGYELGLEPGARGGPHWHVGLFPPGRKSRVFVI